MQCNEHILCAFCVALCELRIANRSERVRSWKKHAYTQTWKRAMFLKSYLKCNYANTQTTPFLFLNPLWTVTKESERARHWNRTSAHKHEKKKKEVLKKKRTNAISFSHIYSVVKFYLLVCRQLGFYGISGWFWIGLGKSRNITIKHYQAKSSSNSPKLQLTKTDVMHFFSSLTHPLARSHNRLCYHLIFGSARVRAPLLQQR